MIGTLGIAIGLNVYRVLGNEGVGDHDLLNKYGTTKTRARAQ
jgi:hypothetical protein